MLDYLLKKTGQYESIEQNSDSHSGAGATGFEEKFRGQHKLRGNATSVWADNHRLCPRTAPESNPTYRACRNCLPAPVTIG